MTLNDDNLVIKNRLAQYIETRGGVATLIFAPAKINLRLKFCGRRADGYHLLSMINAPVLLEDQLLVEFVSGSESSLEVIGADLGDPAANLLIRGTNAFFKEFALEREFALKMQLTKKIPVGAGLGGGSSDLGSLFLFLAQIAGIEPKSLIPLALKLGADVPFFLESQLAAVSGVGEIVTPIECPALKGAPVLLVFPNCSVPTPFAYELIRKEIPQMPDYKDLDLKTFSVELIENDFEHYIARAFPEIEKALAELRTDPSLVVSLSGSGSTVFAMKKNLKDKNLIEIPKALSAKYLQVNFV